ncbi:MAG: M56 family metallopeptidase [Pirellulaceae bacterium]
MSTFLQKLADHPVTEVAGWTLLHFLWQGLLIAAITAVLLAGLRSATASTRYIVACCGMVLMALTPLVTSVWLTNGIEASSSSLVVSGKISNQTLQITPDDVAKNSSTAPSVEVLTQIAPVHSSTSLPETTANPVPAQSEVTWRETLSASFPYFVVLWCAGVLVLSLRLLGGLWRVRQWRRGGVAIESPELIMLVTRLGKKLGLTRRFDLLESASAAVPAVIGWIKPAVIVPTSLLSGLTTAELESLLAHELAHIRRHDYLVNLLQTVIETLLFYHPAIWWLSGVVRCERENCCDDLAVEVCGNKLDFVRALARMEELRCGEPGLALSARGGSLLGRVERLVAPERLTSSRWPAGVAALISVTAVAIGIGMATIADETTSKSYSSPSVNSVSEIESDNGFAKHQSFGQSELDDDWFTTLPRENSLNEPIKPETEWAYADEERVLSTHTYNLSRRESSGWVEVEGTSQPVDDGPEADGVKVYVTLMMDILAVDSATGKVLWHHTYGKQNPSWKTASIVDRGSELPQAERLVAEFVSSDGKTRRRYELRSGKEVTDALAKNADERVRPVRRDGDRVTVAEMESQRAGRSPVELMKRHADVFDRHGRQFENVWVTDQETLVSAEKPSMLPVGPNETMGGLDANEIIFNLPEGSGMRAEFAGENVEITPTESGTTVVVTNGRIKLYDSNGVVRADASPDGGAEQLVADVRTINNEGVLRLRNRRLKPEPAGAWDPLQMRFNLATGAPVDEGQPPHGAVRFAIENPTENEPARMKIRWHYDLQRIVEEAERMSGKELTESPQNSQIWKLSSKGESTLSLQALEDAIKDRRKSEPSSPPLPQTSSELTDDSDFVSKCRTLGDWLEFDKNVRFDSRGYMQLASELLALDEPRRIEALRGLASAGLEGQTIALCKMLFEAKPGTEFRRPGLGKPHLVGTMTEMKDWPLEPITLVGDVPLLIVEGYTLAGLREPSIDYLQYCLANCDWTKRSFSEIEKGLAAAEQVIRQPAFWDGSIDQSEWREWAALRLQLRPSLVIEVMQQPWVSIVTPRYSVLDLGSWKVQEIIEKIKTSGLGADVPTTLIISDNAKLEWIEPLVKQLAEAGYRNQEHIWWQQSHEPIQKPELQKHLTAISTPIGNLDEGWGPTDAKTGLRLRLTLKEKSIPAGKPVLAKLELQNSGDKIAEYDPQIFMPFRVVKVVDGQGKPAMFIGPTPQTVGLQLKLAPDEVVKLWEEVDVSELYLLDSGDYEVSVSLNDRDQNLVMKSGTVGLKINGGQLPQNSQFLKQLREISPAEWDVSTGYGAIYLSHSPTNLKKDVTTIQLWFTEKPLPADYKLGEGEAQQQITTIAPTELGFLHLAAPTRATELWPEHIQKIKIAAARIFNLNAHPGYDKQEKGAPDAAKNDR